MSNGNKTSLGMDAVKLTASKFIAMMISLVIAVILSRYRSLEEYGTYSQLLLVVNLTTVFFMMGLPNTINYFLAQAESKKEKQVFLSVYYTMSTLLSILSGIVLVCITPILVNYFNNDLLTNFLYFLAVYPFARMTMSSIENVLVVYKKTELLFFYRIGNSLFLLLVLLIAHYFKLSFNTYLFMYLLVEVIFALSVFIIVRKISESLFFKVDIKLLKRIFLFSIPIGLASVIGTLNIEIDKLMIGKFLGTEQLAIYTNGSKEMPVAIFATSLTAVLLPQLVRLLKKGEYKQAINLWGETTVLSYMVICFLATGFIAFAPDVITLLYSEKYLPGVTVFIIYNVILLLRCTYFGIILNAIGKTKHILYSSVASLLLNILLNFPFLKYFGMIGPALATLISMYAVMLFQLIATSKVTKQPFSSLLPWREISSITLINILFGIVFYNIKIYLSFEEYYGDVIESMLLGGVWGILYLILIYRKARANWAKLRGAND